MSNIYLCLPLLLESCIFICTCNPLHPFLKYYCALILYQYQTNYYPLANEVAKGYSNATFRNILVNTLESTSFNGF